MTDEEKRDEVGYDPTSGVKRDSETSHPELSGSQYNEQSPQDHISPETHQQIEQQIIGAIVEEQYSGPIPHPNILRQIDEIVPGASREIINNAHGQSAHRQDMERKYLGANIANSRRGQWFGFIIAMTVVLGSMGLIALGYSVWGFSLALFGLSALVGVFVYTQRREGQELKQASQVFQNQASPQEIGASEEYNRNEDQS